MNSQFVRRAFRIFIDTKRRAIWGERRQADGRCDEFETVTLKGKIKNNLRQERTSVIGKRSAKAWMEFFGGAGAAGYLPALEHQRFQSSFREISSSYEPVVAGADNDDSRHLSFEFEVSSLKFKVANAKLELET